MESQAAEKRHTESLQTREAEHSKTLDSLNSEISKPNSVIGEKAKLVDLASEEKSNVEGKLNDLEKQISDLQANNASQSREMDETKSSLEVSQGELKEALQLKSDLEDKLEVLKRTHDDEMGEMVDVVNDLKTKEEELVSVVDDLGKSEAGRATNKTLFCWFLVKNH